MKRKRCPPTQGHPKTFHSLLGRPNPHQIRVGKREKTQGDREDKDDQVDN
jgi:hypothetical protein